MDRTHRTRFLRWMGALAPAGAALLLWLLLPHTAALTERVFARGVFCGLETLLGGAVQFLPFSLTECAVIAAVVVVPIALIAAVVHVIRSPQRRRWLATAARVLVTVLAACLLLYMLLHGVNFYRQSVADLMGLDVRDRSSDELAAVCTLLAERASACRESLPEAEDGTAALSMPLWELLERADEGYDVWDDTYDFLWGAVNRVKPVTLSPLWSYTGITGMYFPLFGEANVNTDQPVYCIAFTAAHELAHTRGFAREDESNFLAFLSATAHPSLDYQYSGYYMAYIYCSNALYAVDPQAWADVRSHLSDGVRRDLQAQNAYWQAFSGPVQDVSTAVNNSFISSQGVADGVNSYGRCVDLILAWAEQHPLGN